MEPGTGAEAIKLIRQLIEAASLGIEVLGVAVIVAAVIKTTIAHGVRYLFRLGEPNAYQAYKREFGIGLLVGMDFLVAGDVIKSVALELTLSSIAALALLVIIRTFLSWSTLVEIEGHWPWSQVETLRANEQRRDRTN
jgi:uncharacterized membrane protein